MWFTIENNIIDLKHTPTVPMDMYASYHIKFGRSSRPKRIIPRRSMADGLVESVVRCYIYYWSCVFMLGNDMGASRLVSL